MLKLAIFQGDYLVGDIAGNLEKIRKAQQQAVLFSCDMLITSEMSLNGYPPEDLVYRPKFQEYTLQALEKVAEMTINAPAIIVGALEVDGRKLYNSAYVFADGKLLHKQRKHDLPNFSVFDEVRVFAKGELSETFDFKGYSIALMICQDMWGDEVPLHFSKFHPDLCICINGSPYEGDKINMRLEAAQRAIKVINSPMLYVNQVGGQDELVFDGASMLLDREGVIKQRLKRFAEDFAVIDFPSCLELAEDCFIKDEMSEIYSAMILGLRDYVNKNGFAGVVLGMSGGIDSALSAAVAVDALGSERVHSLMMPSRFTSRESLEDAADAAQRLNITYETISIEDKFLNISDSLSHNMGDLSDITSQNLQSRLRGLLLMAYSNQKGLMVLTTGNKSEMSVGYATLYGDMCGGFSVLKDIYKTKVFALANWRNKNIPEIGIYNQLDVIPQRVIDKPPSAELKEDQKDEDSLPPYDILDSILEYLVEGQGSVAELVDKGYSKEMVERVRQLLYQAEYKRRQSPPGVKVTSMAFGRDRRYPITNKFQIKDL